ncbi:MAG: uroporphyrinogen decarboxylase family protein [bacterium]
MTSYERTKMLLNKEIPDRMGIFEHFWPETLEQFWPPQGYPKGGNPSYYFDYDIVYCGGWINSEPFIGVREVIKETEEWRIIKDGRGATLKFWKNKSGTPEHIGFEITEREKWKTYREPLLEIRKERLGDLENMRLNLKIAREREKFTIFGDLFIFELMRATIGDQNFLPALLLDPDWIRDFAQVYLDFYRNHYDMLFRKVGLPDGFLVYEDFGYSNGLFCSPKVLSELIMPYEKEFVSFLKSYGLPVILHSCGDIRKAVPLIIDAGYDCLQPMEAKAGCNVVEFAKTYGNKLAYMGNINVVVLNTNDPLKIKEEVLPKLKVLSRMKIPYFFHSDHSIPPTVTLETYRYALSLFNENCWYF